MRDALARSRRIPPEWLLPIAIVVVVMLVPVVVPVAVVIMIPLVVVIEMPPPRFPISFEIPAAFPIRLDPVRFW